jgi:hypothetical protein
MMVSRWMPLIGTCAAVAAALTTTSAGCNAITGATGFYVAPAPADAGGPSPEKDGAASPTGDAAPDASAVDSCVPGTDRRTFEEACTQSVCVPFATPLPSCDAGLCPLPAAAAPASDGGTEAGAPPDAGDAGAALPSCSQVFADSDSVVYVTGSTALASFIGEVSLALVGKVTIVYQGSGSCIGVQSMLDPSDNILSSANGPATYYTASGVQQTCTLDPGDRLVADVGASDVFYSTCYQGQATTPPLPASVGENFGPVQIMNFSVPQASTQQSISLGAAYYVFGFGGATYPIAPWTDPAQLQIRSAASGTQSLIGAAIGVPPSVWYGVGHSTSAQVGSALVAAGQSGDQRTIDAALGILASDYLLQNTQLLRGLAVEDDVAGCGYYPNSTAFGRDNANARDGHYPLWGPSHFYARIDPSTTLPLKGGVSQFIDGLNGLTALPGLDLVAEYASKGLVPQCAMHVTRTNDGGDYTAFKAPVTCNCYFDLHASGVMTCRTCTANSDCPASAPNCNSFGPKPQQGYCDL